jgi:hypothetical protein
MIRVWSFLETLHEMLAQTSLEGVAVVCPLADRWHERRIAFGEEEISACVAEDESGVTGLIDEGFVGLFCPPLGGALLDHVLWARRAAGGGGVLALIRTEAEKGRVWALARRLPRGSMAAEAWSEGGTLQAVKVAGELPRRHPWLRAGERPPAPYLRDFSWHPDGAFAGLLADFASAGDPDWEFTAVTFLAAAAFASAAARACPTKACDFALLGGPAGATLTARGMERALIWRALQQENQTVVELLPADAPRPVWSFTLCGKHAQELLGLCQAMGKEGAR